VDSDYHVLGEASQLVVDKVVVAGLLAREIVDEERGSDSAVGSRCLVHNVNHH
jgi:hypothetical protein